MGNSVAKTIRKSCFSSLFLAATTAVLLHTEVAYAQSALATVAYITMTLEPKSGQFGIDFTDKGNLLVVKQAFGDLINFEKTAECKYRIKGERFFADNRYPVEYTVDFSNMRKPFTPVIANPDEKMKYVYLKVPGVRVCSIKAMPTDNIQRLRIVERFPKSGECRDHLETAVLLGLFEDSYLADKARMEKALDYLSSNFCKGSAF